MGQQVSKDIRSRLEHCTLEELLIDDKYVEELERHLPGLPKRSHNNLAKILASWENTLSKDSNSGSQPNPPPKGGNSSPKDRNSRTCKLGSLWSIQPKDISIPQSVAEVLKQNHCNLLRQSSKNGVDLQSPADYYEYTCNVETGRTLDKILWRFLTTFYYDLISELDATKQRLSTTENGGVAFVVAVVCRSGKHDPDTVREKVIGWAKVGRRYRGFMDALCSGCLILFPERTSDLVWEQYVPIKGDTFAKVIQFLRDLGIVYKCEKEGWNDLSDKILQALREPFRSFISFQFQPGQQSQIGWAAISSLAQVPGDADIHRPGLSILSCDPVEEIQDMGIDNPSSSKTLDSRALPRLAANRVIKTKRKKGSTSVRRQLQSFAKYLTAHQTPRPEKSLPLVVRQSHHASRAHRSEIQHETHGRDPQGQFPRAPTQCWASAPNDPGQRHLATNHQDDSLPSFQLPTNDQLRKPQRTGESISDTLRLERIGISTISAVLNNNTSTTALATAQDSLQGSEDGCTETVSGVAGTENSRFQRCLLTVIRSEVFR
ncbi:hypothetical protein BDZ45DRAFT_182906 [Acephala macrosclerotiorum]|nr:hypothetical protein BDZ45DRAFT_182906 [Acephala macrosclerotiorum]